MRPPFRGDLLARVAAVILTLFVLGALFGRLLPLGDPTAIGLGPRLAAPAGGYPAGTDALGRSLLPRLVQGLGTTLLLAGASVVIVSLASVLLGMMAAYFRGVFGELVMRATDLLFSFPALLLAILVVAITGPGETGAVISIVFICAPQMIRVVRAAALTVVGRDFVVAARVGGTGPTRVLFAHVLPNIAGAAIVQSSYLLSIGMLVESGLSFLGLGVQPPQASLGSLVHDGAAYLSLAPWLVLFPGALLAVVIVCVNLVGDGLRDLFDVQSVEVRR